LDIAPGAHAAFAYVERFLGPEHHGARLARSAKFSAHFLNSATNSPAFVSDVISNRATDLGDALVPHLLCFLAGLDGLVNEFVGVDAASGSATSAISISSHFSVSFSGSTKPSVWFWVSLSLPSVSLRRELRLRVGTHDGDPKRRPREKIASRAIGRASARRVLSTVAALPRLRA
jgi:hypothetical protein